MNFSFELQNLWHKILAKWGRTWLLASNWENIGFLDVPWSFMLDQQQQQKKASPKAQI
jgi:hypothetical protein